MTKTFYDNRRPIKINVLENAIQFTYPTEGDREFYWIPKHDWVEDRTKRLDRQDNWHYHMKEKNWFKNEMYEFIESSC